MVRFRLATVAAFLMFFRAALFWFSLAISISLDKLDKFVLGNNDVKMQPTPTADIGDNA